MVLQIHAELFPHFYIIGHSNLLLLFVWIVVIARYKVSRFASENSAETRQPQAFS